MNTPPTQHSSPDRQESSPTKKVLLNILKYFLAAVVVYFAARQVAKNWNSVIAYDWTVNPWLLVLSIIAHILTFALFSKAWCYLIEGFGYRVSLLHGFKLAYIANLGRYIPGKIWAIFGMAFLARRLRIREEASVASWVIAVVFSLPGAFLISFVAAILYPEIVSPELADKIGNSMYVLAAVTLAASLFLVIAPNTALGMFNLFLRLIRRPIIDFQITTCHALKIYLCYTLAWIAFGVSFWIFLHSVTPEMIMPIGAAVGTYVFAYQIGFVAIFSPGGLGVRELAMTAMLGAYFGPIAAGIAVAARLWNVVAEILSAVIALKIPLKETSENPPHPVDSAVK